MITTSYFNTFKLNKPQQRPDDGYHSYNSGLKLKQLNSDRVELSFKGYTQDKIAKLKEKVQVESNIKVPSDVKNYCNDNDFEVLGSVKLNVYGQDEPEVGYIVVKGARNFSQFAVNSNSQMEEAQTGSFQILDSKGKLICSTLMSLCQDKDNLYGIPEIKPDDTLLYSYSIVNYSGQDDKFVNNYKVWAPNSVNPEGCSDKKVQTAAKIMLSLFKLLDIADAKVMLGPSLNSTERFHKTILGAKETPKQVKNDLNHILYVETANINKRALMPIEKDLVLDKACLEKIYRDPKKIELIEGPGATVYAVKKNMESLWY